MYTVVIFANVKTNVEIEEALNQADIVRENYRESL